MLLLIPLLPLVGFLINASFGRRLSKNASGIIACAVMVLSFAVSVAAVAHLIQLPAEARVIDQTAFNWISSGQLSVDLTLRLDPLCSVMILIITGIGSLIHVYSTAYMHDETDPEYARYFSYLNLFAAFMLVLVLGSNFLVMFVGWEGVGLFVHVGRRVHVNQGSDAGDDEDHHRRQRIEPHRQVDGQLS